MSDEIQAIHQISKALQQAFKKINTICASFTKKTSSKQHKEKSSKKKRWEGDRKSQEKMKNKEKVPVKKCSQDPSESQEEISDRNVKIQKKAERQVASKKSKKEAHAKKRKSSEESENNDSDEDQEKSHKNTSSPAKKESGKKETPVRHPDRPKNPPTAFFLFMGKNRKSITEEYPKLKGNEVITVISQIWNELNSDEKSSYEDECNSLRKAYEKRMSKFLKEHPDEMSKAEKKRAKAQGKVAVEGKLSSPQTVQKHMKEKSIEEKFKSNMAHLAHGIKIKVVDEDDNSLGEEDDD